jgi:hypothetical protein
VYRHNIDDLIAESGRLHAGAVLPYYGEDEYGRLREFRLSQFHCDTEREFQRADESGNA